jgi:hypothetical protein
MQFSPTPAAPLLAVAPPATVAASPPQHLLQLGRIPSTEKANVQPAAAADAEPQARLPDWVNPDNAVNAVGVAVGGTLAHRLITRPRDRQQAQRRIEWRESQLLLLNEYIDEEDTDYDCILGCAWLQVCVLSISP